MPAGSSTLPESVVVVLPGQSGICAQTPVQPHVLAWAPPPHVFGEAHVPQEMVFPQPSPIWPQFAF
jgi:hypothetical protein